MARAQVCFVTNSSLNGAYGFLASEAGAIPATTTGTGTTGTTGASGSSTNGYSTTELGSLLGGIAAGNQFGLSGVLFFDGAGNIDATSSPTAGAEHLVGSYNVNSDCSISVSLTDVFGTNTTMTQWVGIVLGRGTEIDLTTVSNLNSQTAVVTSTGTSSTGTGTTNGTGTTGTGTTTTTGTQSASGLTIKLVKVLFSCSNANLYGVYGFVLNPIQIQTQTSATGTTGSGTGTGTGTTGTGTGKAGSGTTGTGTGTTTGTTTTQPPTMIGYLDFDGNGNIIAQPTNAANAALGSMTYPALVFTGTYSVNADCTGSMTISNPATTSSTSTTTTSGTGSSSTNQTLTIDFVISPPTVTEQPGSIYSSAFSGSPTLNLSFTDSDESGWGYALPQ
jgi:hypothetical protein